MTEPLPEKPLDFVQRAVFKHTDFSAARDELQELVEDFKTLSGSLVVIFNEVSVGEDFTTTRAMAGLKEKWSKISEILGFPVLNTSYNLDPAIAEAFRRDGLVEYSSIFDLSRHQIPEAVCKLLSRLFNTGKLYVLGLKAEGRLLGDFVFIQMKGQNIAHPEMVELFGRHVTLFLLQYRRRQSGFLQTLADRSQSEQTGRALVESFYRATEKIPDLVYQLDPAGRIVFINHAIERYGYGTEDLVGQSILDIVHPEDRDKTFWNLKERRRGDRKTVDVEVRFITGKSKTVFFSVTEKEHLREAVVKLYSEGLYDGSGDQEQFLGTLGVCRDITAERELRVQLDNQVEAFHIIAEHTDDGIWLEQVDPPRILYSNAAAKKLAAPVKPDIQKTVVSYLHLVHPEDLDRVRQYAGTLDFLKGPSEIEFRMLPEAGGLRWIQLRLFPVFYQGHRTNKRVGMVTDITRQKLYQEGLLSEIEKERAYMRELNHRVKNNLAMIEHIISLEISSLSEEEGLARNVLSDIRGRMQSIGLVHRMLYDMSRQGMIEVHEYLRMLGTAVTEGAAVRTEGPAVIIDISGRYWMPVKEVIPIGMITHELITNALKYAFPDGKGGRITVGFQEESPGRFLLSVADNGAAIPKEEDQGSSSGIGRVLVEALTAQLEGEYDVITSPGEKCFRVRFPSKAARRDYPG